MRALNIGCGQHFHPDWVNLDRVASDPSVIEHDIRTGLPFERACFDVVYLCHVLEHFPREQAAELLSECQRTLAPGGVIRVVVPDLERIARDYLGALARARAGDAAAEFEIDWLRLEMLDQVGRNRSGGDIARVASKLNAEQRAFVVQRWGMTAREMFAGRASTATAPSRPGVKRVARGVGTLARTRELLKKWVLGDEYRLLEIGRFREGGERHCGMYDAHSLSGLLTRAGFHAAEVQQADTSAIPDWKRFQLDTEPDGTERKPDSVYVEARKI